MVTHLLRIHLAPPRESLPTLLMYCPVFSLLSSAGCLVRRAMVLMTCRAYALLQLLLLPTLTLPFVMILKFLLQISALPPLLDPGLCLPIGPGELNNRVPPSFCRQGCSCLLSSDTDGLRAFALMGPYTSWILLSRPKDTRIKEGVKL